MPLFYINVSTLTIKAVEKKTKFGKFLKSRENCDGLLDLHTKCHASENFKVCEVYLGNSGGWSDGSAL